MFRGGFVTVIGNGSDAHLAVGTAQFLQKNHPTGVDPSQAVDRVPLVWRSKPPIYLSYGGVAQRRGDGAVRRDRDAVGGAAGVRGARLLARRARAARRGRVGRGGGDGTGRPEPDRAVHRHAPVLQPDVGLHGDAVRDRARVVRRATTIARRRDAVRGVPRGRRVRLSAGAADPAAAGDHLRGVRAPPARAVAAAHPAAAQQAPAAVDRAAVSHAHHPAAGRAREDGGVDARAGAGLLARQLGRRPDALLPRALLPRHRRRRRRAVRAAAVRDRAVHRAAHGAPRRALGDRRGARRSASSRRCSSARASTAGTSTTRRWRSSGRSS